MILLYSLIIFDYNYFSMQNKGIILSIAVLVLIVVLVLVSFLGYSYYTSTPAYTVGKMHEAAKEGDYEEFSKYVDEELLFENIEYKIRKQAEDSLINNEVFQNHPFNDMATGLIDSGIDNAVENIEVDFRSRIENKESFQEEPKYDTIKRDGDEFTIEGANSNSSNPNILKFHKKDGVWQYYDFEIAAE